MRARLRLSQRGLALRIGAAGKAVIYQWDLELYPVSDFVGPDPDPRV